MMSHWRTSRIASGGQPRPGSHYAHNTPRDLNLFPSQSILHREDIGDAPLNILLAIQRGSLALCALGCVVFLGGFWVLFFWS